MSFCYVSFIFTNLLLHAGHRLLGSASPVLTATGFVNVKRQFSTPCKIDTPQPITKQICHRWLRRRLLQLCQIRCTYVHGGGFWAHG